MVDKRVTEADVVVVVVDDDPVADDTDDDDTDAAVGGVIFLFRPPCSRLQNITCGVPRVLRSPNGWLLSLHNRRWDRPCAFLR